MKFSIDRTRLAIAGLVLGTTLIIIGLIVTEIQQYKQIISLKGVTTKPVIKYVLVTPTATPTATLISRPVEKGAVK